MGNAMKSKCSSCGRKRSMRWSPPQRYLCKDCSRREEEQILASLGVKSPWQ